MKKNKRTETAPTRRESPFAQCIEKDEYFTGFGHLNVFASIRRDIDASVPVIVLTGEGGCGKSALGKMLMSETETISSFIPVYFRKTIDSFEDVVGVMASKVGVEVIDTSRAGITVAIDQIATVIEQGQQRFLLICDGAEQIYLATLERIRRMLDRLNRPGVRMQMILIGRPVLLDNLKQLRLCNFAEVSEKKYVLEPLSLAETTSYLEFSKRRMSEPDARLFTPDVVDRIYRASAGNIKKINHFAEEIYSRKGKEDSFRVLPENVGGGAAASIWNRCKQWLTLLTWEKPPLRAGLVGAAIVGFGLLLFVFTEGEETQPLPAETMVVESQDQNVQAAQDMTDSASRVAARRELPSPSAKEVMPTVMAPPEEPEQEYPDAQPPGKAAIVSSAEVAAESSVPPTASIEEPIPIAGDGGNRPPEPAELSEDRQKVESLLAEAEEAVEAARQEAGEVAPSRPDGSAPVKAGVDKVGKDLAAVNGGEGVNSALLVERTGDSSETAVPAPLVLRPIKVKKVVITKLQAVQPDRYQDNSRNSDLLTAVGSSSKILRLQGAEGKKKVLPESAAPAAITAEQAPFGQKSRQPDREGGAHAEKSKSRNAGIPGSPDKIAPVRSESKKIPVLGQAIVPRTESAVKKSVHQLEDHPGNPSRVDADPSWLAGTRDGKYTLQLMALSSAAAVDNVKQIITGNPSVRDAGTFYIFEKKGTSPEIFVFFGEYDSVGEAGKARDSLPETLRKHKPYVLSVKSAMEKVK